MQATVQGDIPVAGSMFSCQNCHLRSGLGAREGRIITMPVNGPKLLRPLYHGAEIETTPPREQLGQSFQGPLVRPAYTADTLADAIWYGTRPDGSELDWTMPRYDLSERDMRILVYYLLHLSDRYSPGVDDTTLRLATIIGSDLPERERRAVLDTLNAYVRARNNDPRRNRRRARHGPFYHQESYTAYRRIELQVWELRGPPASWRAQLETYYHRRPPFALIGGRVKGPWAPIHDFCEEHRLPALFPETDRPKIATSGWYTLYFSRGAYQQGETVAYFLDRQSPPPSDIWQVIAPTAEARLIARGFQQTWQRLGHPPPRNLFFKGRPVPAGRLPADATLLVWLDARKLSVFLDSVPKFDQLFLAGSLLRLQEGLELARKLSPKRLYLAWPYRLPERQEPFLRPLRQWLKVHRVPLHDLKIQADTYFLGWMLTGALKAIRNDFYRDYLLDMLDMMEDQTYANAFYPRLSFGPGQRYASKGGYVLRLRGGETPGVEAASPWLTH